MEIIWRKKTYIDISYIYSYIFIYEKTFTSFICKYLKHIFVYLYIEFFIGFPSKYLKKDSIYYNSNVDNASAMVQFLNKSDVIISLL